MEKDKIKKVAKKIIDSNCLAILTGAGISAESGVPTFRDAQTGLWAKYDPLKLATPSAFKENPELVWSWYQYRKKLIEKVKPNAGHYVIKEIENIKKNFLLITQNVDDLHRKAGNKKIVELHGNIFRYRCFNFCEYYYNIESEKPIKCKKCGEYIRPDVVWFGEQLPEEALKTSYSFIKECDLFFSIGTSSVVQPAASFPFIAKENGAFLVEININDTPVTGISDITIKGKSAEILSFISEEIKKFLT